MTSRENENLSHQRKNVGNLNSSLVFSFCPVVRDNVSALSALWTIGSRILEEHELKLMCMRMYTKLRPNIKKVIIQVIPKQECFTL